MTGFSGGLDLGHTTDLGWLLILFLLALAMSAPAFLSWGYSRRTKSKGAWSILSLGCVMALSGAYILSLLPCQVGLDSGLSVLTNVPLILYSWSCVGSIFVAAARNSERRFLLRLIAFQVLIVFSIAALTIGLSVLMEAVR